MGLKLGKYRAGLLKFLLLLLWISHGLPLPAM
jgi:hypothetical protein